MHRKCILEGAMMSAAQVIDYSLNSKLVLLLISLL